MNEATENDLLAQSETQMRKGMLVYCVLLLLKDGKVYTSEIIRALHQAELIVRTSPAAALRETRIRPQNRAAECRCQIQCATALHLYPRASFLLQPLL